MTGGGDRSRGETGQRGVSLLSSLPSDNFLGTGAFISESWAAGGNAGNAAEDKTR